VPPPGEPGREAAAEVRQDFCRAALRARAAVAGVAATLAGVASSGCRDVSGFSTGAGASYQGVVVDADFVRSGVTVGTSLCLTLDADHLQDVPGSISTSDGQFHATPLRPIPQIWHDPLSTLSFGEGRIKNLVYIATAAPASDGGPGSDTLAVVSLMQSGGVEVRLIRGAPAVASDGGPVPLPSNSVFAVFPLSRENSPCSF
jgi:hypothetical protein